MVHVFLLDCSMAARAFQRRGARKRVSATERKSPSLAGNGELELDRLRLFRTFPNQHSGRSTHRWCGVRIFELVPSESEVRPLLFSSVPVRERTVFNTKI